MKKYLFILSSFFIIGCSTGEGGNPNTRTTNVQVNVAKNASATASYDSENAKLVIDSDSSTSNYWSGNISGDDLTIDLGNITKITKIVVYTNKTSVSTLNPAVTYELSPDGKLNRTSIAKNF